MTRGLACTGDIIEMFNFLHPEQSLDLIDRSLVVPAEHRVDVRYNPLSICGAVCGHVLADWLEVLPEIADGLDNCRLSIRGIENI